MSTFGRDDLRSLLAPHEVPCVSLFVPRHAHPPDSGQDPVRLRNMIRSLEGRVSATGFGRVGELLEPLSAATSDLETWSQPRDSLALFRAPDFFARYALPTVLPERLVVADTFHVRPLLRFLETNQRYYVLALSQHHARLHEGTPFSLAPVELAGLPSSLEDASAAEHEPFLNFHRVGPGGGSAIFHGHGSTAETNEEDLRRYFRAIDAAAWKLLREEQAPLFLAGVARYLPLYREISRYPHIAGSGVEGNVDGMSPAELQKRVLPLVSEVFRARERQALDDFSKARGRGLAALDLQDVGRHAVAGRVRQLLLGLDRHAWGSFDFETGRVRSAADERPLRDDVLDDLAQTVLVHGGDVVSLPAESMPEASPVAAVLRW